MTTKRLISFITLSTLVFNCGGIKMTGTEKKKEEAKEDDENQKATDPSVVTGTYLACEIEITPQNRKLSDPKTKAPNTVPQKTAAKTPAEIIADAKRVGCNIMANGRVIDPTAAETFSFTSSTNGAVAMPADTNSKSGYQAVFATKASDLQASKFEVKVLENNTVKGEASCDGSKLPCMTALNIEEMIINSIGQWNPHNGLSTLASTISFSSSCPNNPDNFCEANAQLSTKKPSEKIDHATKTACTGLLGSAVGGVLSGVTGSDPMAAFDAIPTAFITFTLNKASACIVKKKSTVNGSPKFLNKGDVTGCYSTMLKRNGKVMILIMNEANVVEQNQMEANLSRFACP